MLVPTLKKSALNDRITVPIEAELKRKIRALRLEHDVDTLELIRRWIREGMAQVESLFAKQG